MKEHCPLIDLNLDRIFCINLKRRTDRREWAESQFSGVGLLEHITWYDAYDAKAHGIQEKNDGHRILTPGMYGCFMSHKLIFEEAIRNGYQSFAIFEDDLLLSFGFNDMLKWMLPNIPANWQWAYLGCTEYGGFGAHKEQVNDCWVIPNSAWGTQAYMVRTPEAIKAIYDRLIWGTMQIDEMLANYILKESGINYYSTFPSLVSQNFEGLGSDIQTTQQI